MVAEHFRCSKAFDSLLQLGSGSLGRPEKPKAGL